MITKLYIPVEKLKTDFDTTQDMSDFDYNRMIDYRANEEFNQISSYLSGNDPLPNDGLRYYVRNEKNTQYDDLNDSFEACEAQILDIDNIDLLGASLEPTIANGDMSVLIIKINPNSILEDTETELRLWLNQTSIINKNPKLSDDDKLVKLPTRTLKIQRDNDVLILHNCRIIDIYGDMNKGKFDFAILIKKITY